MAPQDLYGLPGVVGAGPIITIKRGTGAGNYVTTSASYVDIDATNLIYTVTIPIGQKLIVWASGSSHTNAPAASKVAIYDSVAATQVAANSCDGTTDQVWMALAIITGDGASHVVKLQFKTVGTLNVINIALPENPQMVFWLAPAN